MGSRLFTALIVFVLWLLCKDSIQTWSPNVRLLTNLLGVGLPICLLLEPVIRWIGDYIKMRMLLNDACKKLFKHGKRVEPEQQYQERVYQKPYQEPVYEQKSLLDSAQIKQLNRLRTSVPSEGAQKFPIIRISGKSLPNLVPEAGVFTAKINKDGQLQNIVVLLATLQAVSQFQNMCATYGVLQKDFWAEGHLLPSRTGVCYSVLWVTSFRFCGRAITF